MAELTIKLHRRYLYDKEASEAFLVRRIANTCCSNPQPVKKDTGYKYMLDNSNDWWCSGIEADGTIKVAYRYGGGERNNRMMVALLELLNWHIGEDK